MTPPSPEPASQPVRAGSGYLLAIVGSAAGVAIAALAERALGLRELSPIFMLTVLLVASRTRMGPAVLTAVSCFLAYNFFFIEPRYTFYISAHDGIATVVAFLAAALFAARLAAHLAARIEALRTAATLAAARQTLAQGLAAAVSEEEASDALRAIFRERMGMDISIALYATPAPDASIEAQDDEAGGLPLRSADRILGVVELLDPAGTSALDADRRALARTMADDFVQALIRIRLAAELQTQRVAAETERLRNALLSSVSHDLRSPLAAIIGSASSLEHYWERMNGDDRRQLLGTIRSEGERLDRYIQNLLDMTRLGHGGLSLHRDWIGVDELVGAAAGRIRAFLPGARVEIASHAEMAPLWVHPAMLEQALFNVVENAVKFSPDGEVVRVAFREGTEGDPDDTRSDSQPARAAVVFEIDDRGPGIPEEDRSRIFDMFHTVARGDRGRGGTGLGLSIAQGMVGAHGGRIEALAGPDGRGTRIRIVLPRIEPTEASA
ncbi:MAG: sensor histidine kinase [Pseudomonadota bacterium]